MAKKFDSDSLPAPPPPPMHSAVSLPAELPPPHEPPAPPAAALQASDDKIAQLEEQVATIAGQLNQTLAQLTQLTGLMTAGGKLSQAALAGQPVAALGAAQLPIDGGSNGDAEAFSEDEYFVRIKPYDPQRGFVRKRQYFNELGRAINGGTGAAGDIPEWVKVNRAQAMSLAEYRQDDNRLDSPTVLDIVTAGERHTIDTMEDQHRMASLGLAGFTPQAMMQAAQRPGFMQARTGSSRAGAAATASPVARSVPSVVQGAQAFAPHTPMALPSAAAAGRMAALADVPANRGVAEDLTMEALRDAEAAEALAAAEKYQ